MVYSCPCHVSVRSLLSPPNTTCRDRLHGVRHSLTASQVAELADAAHGFVGADLAALVSEASIAALR
jgi:SpoVK/Ycf46/Vps4 family AAA+-type ATPase